MRFALAGLGLIALGAAAPGQAADIPMPVKGVRPAYVHAYYNWTGFYVGAHVGYGWADFSGTDALAGVVTDTATAKGLIYGGQLGFNYQLGSWVFGIEGEFTLRRRQDSRRFARPRLRRDQARPHLHRRRTRRLRVRPHADLRQVRRRLDPRGIQFHACSAAPPPARWTAPAGCSASASNTPSLGNWSAKIEYNYMDMGSKAVTLTTTGGLVVTPANVDLTVQTVKAGRQLPLQLGPLLILGRREITAGRRRSRPVSFGLCARKPAPQGRRQPSAGELSTGTQSPILRRHQHRRRDLRRGANSGPA